LTNNYDNILNKTKKNLNNLIINFILKPKNNSNMHLINLYTFIIYINLKLFSFKLNNNITTYEDLLKKINELDINNNTSQNELSSKNLNLIYNLMEYICYKGKFQIDIIDLRLSEIFLNVENEIKKKLINPNNFDEILIFINNNIFLNLDCKNNPIKSSKEKNLIDINNEYEIQSYSDYSEGIKEKLINKRYQEKLLLNDSFDNFLKSKDSMVNLEGLTINKYISKNELLSYDISNKENNFFSLYNVVNNKVINKIQKEDQLILSNYKKKFILISSLYNYIYPIKRIMEKNNKNYFVEKRNIYKFLDKKYNDEKIDFIDIHNSNILIRKIGENYYLNKNNIGYANNYIFKKRINKKKISTKFYEN